MNTAPSISLLGSSALLFEAPGELDLAPDARLAAMCGFPPERRSTACFAPDWRRSGANSRHTGKNLPQSFAGLPNFCLLGSSRSDCIRI